MDELNKFLNKRKEWLKNINFKKVINSNELKEDIKDKFYDGYTEDEFDLIYYDFIDNAHKCFTDKHYTDNYHQPPQHYYYSIKYKDYFNNLLKQNFFYIKNQLFRKEDFFVFLTSNIDRLKKSDINTTLIKKLQYNFQDEVDNFTMKYYKHLICNKEFYKAYTPFKTDEDYNYFFGNIILRHLKFEPYNKSFYIDDWSNIIKKYFEKVKQTIRINYSIFDERLLLLEINSLESLKHDAQYEFINFESIIIEYRKILADLKQLEKTNAEESPTKIKLQLSEDYSHGYLEKEFNVLYKHDDSLKQTIRSFIFNSFNTKKPNQKFRKRKFINNESIIPIYDTDIFVEFFWVMHKEGIIENSFSEIATFLSNEFKILGTKESLEKKPSSKFNSNYKQNPNLKAFLENSRINYTKQSHTNH